MGGSCLRGQWNSVLPGKGQALPVLYIGSRKQTSTNVKLFELFCDAPRISEFEGVQISHTGMLCYSSDFEITKSSEIWHTACPKHLGKWALNQCGTWPHPLFCPAGETSGFLIPAQALTPPVDPWGGAENERLWLC